MREYIPLFTMKFMWAFSIVLCSVCKNSKIKSKSFKNERWKNTKKSDQILALKPLKPPFYLVMSQIGYW